MSSNVLNNKSLLHMLLTDNTLQKKGLLSSLDSHQSKLISEIFYNLQHLDLDENEKKFLNKYKSLVKKLGNLKLRYKQIKNIIKTSKLSIIKILMFFKTKLETLVS